MIQLFLKWSWQFILISSDFFSIVEATYIVWLLLRTWFASFIRNNIIEYYYASIRVYYYNVCHIYMPIYIYVYIIYMYNMHPYICLLYACHEKKSMITILSKFINIILDIKFNFNRISIYLKAAHCLFYYQIGRTNENEW